MHAFPSVESMWTLKDLDVRYLVSPEPVDTATWPLMERARFPSGHAREPTRYIYELVWSDDVEQRLGPPSTPVPPEPGPMPLPTRERLQYRVTWDAPTGTVTAGSVSLEIEPPESASGDSTLTSAAHRFIVRARTAPWIARFFEADDRFVTVVDRVLMPLHHERALREGRRSVDQRYTFDAAAGQMRLLAADGQPAGPVIRLWPHARDGVAALYYVRTLDLTPGATIELPVVENGRNQTLAITAAGAEVVTAGGRSWNATRLEVTVRQRVARRTAPQVTVWLAREAPRPLVAAEVRAVFGNLRIELDPSGGSPSP